MSFISNFFIILLPIAVGGYYLLPIKYRNLFLLLVSYFAYWRWNGTFILLIVYATAVSYIGGIIIDKKRNKKVLGIFVVLNILPLFLYKYVDFLISIVNDIFSIASVNSEINYLNLVLPVGISFFTFQTLSYVIDVYRGDTPVNKSVINYSLYVSFFPQLVAGPIEKSKTFLKQFEEVHQFDEKRITMGFMQILWGFFLKTVIADRTAIVVDHIFGNIAELSGFYMVIGAVFFLVQIFCDFCGYTTIALGTAEMLGFKLTDNFQAPLLSYSVSDFWRRWHISLSTWFKEYVYIPLGGNRKGTLRKYVNITIVFAISGMWHGANWGFLIWGLLNAFYQIIEDIIYRKKDIKPKDFSGRLLFTAITFLLVAFSFIFFRTAHFTVGIQYVEKMFSAWNPWVLVDGSLYDLGLSANEFRLLLCSIILLVFTEYFKKRGIVIREIIYRQNIVGRYLFYIFSVAFMVVFARYGEATSSFIYFAF